VFWYRKAAFCVDHLADAGIGVGLELSRNFLRMSSGIGENRKLFCEAAAHERRCLSGGCGFRTDADKPSEE
jgi:hypothetical protein